MNLLFSVFNVYELVILSILTSMYLLFSVPTAILGAVYLISRNRYIKGYIQDPEKRYAGCVMWCSLF